MKRALYLSAATNQVSININPEDQNMNAEMQGLFCEHLPSAAAAIPMAAQWVALMLLQNAATPSLPLSKCAPNSMIKSLQVSTTESPISGNFEMGICMTRAQPYNSSSTSLYSRFLLTQEQLGCILETAAWFARPPEHARAHAGSSQSETHFHQLGSVHSHIAAEGEFMEVGSVHLEIEGSDSENLSIRPGSNDLVLLVSARLIASYGDSWCATSLKQTRGDSSRVNGNDTGAGCVPCYVAIGPSHSKLLQTSSCTLAQHPSGFRIQHNQVFAETHSSDSRNGHSGSSNESTSYYSYHHSRKYEHLDPSFTSQSINPLCIKKPARGELGESSSGGTASAMIGTRVSARISLDSSDTQPPLIFGITGDTPSVTAHNNESLLVPQPGEISNRSTPGRSVSFKSTTSVGFVILHDTTLRTLPFLDQVNLVWGEGGGGSEQALATSVQDVGDFGGVAQQQKQPLLDKIFEAVQEITEWQVG